MPVIGPGVTAKVALLPATSFIVPLFKLAESKSSPSRSLLVVTTV